MSLRRVAQSLVQQLTGAAEGSLFATRPLESAYSFESVRNASNQAVKLRIRAIKNIGKITKAMKMVAASKMRAAQVAVDNSRGIVDPFYRLFGDYPGKPKLAHQCAHISTSCDDAIAFFTQLLF